MGQLNFGTLSLGASSLGSSLSELLLCDDIEPGSEPGYQTCKTVYLYHPLGAKIVETPIKIAQSQPRQITVDNSPEQQVRDAFTNEWKRLRCDYYIRGVMYTARIYGIAVLAMGMVDEESKAPLDLWALPKKELYFSVFDPLNVAGSLVLDQNPNSPTFQKWGDVAVSSQVYHRSKVQVMLNEQPVYLSYTSSAFGFSGRSVYQRSLYPLKSFVQSMITDDMVTRKAGLLVAMLKSAGSIINNIMQAAAGIKRVLLQQGASNNVLSVGQDDKIESIDLQNIDKAMITARGNVIKNIATACDMPAQILEQESFAEGFGEGTEDTKNVIRYVNGVREEMQPVYHFLDRIVQHRAWTPELFEAIKADNPGLYDGRQFTEVFYEWQKNFKAEWPSLLEEPESEQAKLEKVKLEGLMSIYEALSATADPDNKARLAEWVCDNANELKRLFRVGLELDIDMLREYFETSQEQQDDAADAELQSMTMPPLKAVK